MNWWIKELAVFAAVMVPGFVALAFGAPDFVFALGIAALLGRGFVAYRRQEAGGLDAQREGHEWSRLELGILVGAVLLCAVSVPVFNGDLVGQITYALIATFGIAILAHQVHKRSTQ